jgi:hypothetical protein
MLTDSSACIFTEAPRLKGNVGAMSSFFSALAREMYDSLQIHKQRHLRELIKDACDRFGILKRRLCIDKMLV